MEYRAPDALDYPLDIHQPLAAPEPVDQESAVVDEALRALVAGGILPHGDYDRQAVTAFREKAADMDITWSAITPRMQRLLQAINDIHRPGGMVAAGIFCGYTFACNAAPAIAGADGYRPRRLVGLDIEPASADLARRNLQRIAPDAPIEIIADDAVAWCGRLDEPVDLLYLDADGQGGRGKAIYLDILHACLDHLTPGALVLAHNSLNCASALQEYLHFVRQSGPFQASMHVVIDDQGLEVSRR
jgi:predicted O-methyltransferase YrrM